LEDIESEIIVEMTDEIYDQIEDDPVVINSKGD
jgi:hypothetical protein